MRFHTHDRTPRPKTSKLIKSLLAVCAVLIYGIFALLSFACFYYARSITGAVSMIILPIVLTACVLIPIGDMKKAYIEINGDSIHVVDYYLGVKKENTFSFSDITSAEVVLGYSHRVKGCRMGLMGMQYIVLKQGEAYLFKIIRCPETEQLFAQYICNE